jgi:colanic acid biosynthesis glycosyl transferase WcaI
MSERRKAPAAERRLVIHDYSGHPFQIQLSRELAERGWVVHHQYCPSYVSGHGDMRRRASDPPSLRITEIPLRRPFDRYRAWMRLMQEVEYAFKAFRAIRAARPEQIILCNIPLLANWLLVVMLLSRRLPYVFWHQDVYSEAIRESLRRRRPGRLAVVLGGMAEAAERWVVRRSSHVVAITPLFADKYRQWKLSPHGFTVIPNWAEVDPFRDLHPNRRWLGDDPGRPNLLLYAGTLGLKHDPALLLALAKAPGLSDCTVAVVSEGKGRDWLASRGSSVEGGRLVLRDYVPFTELPSVLASADVLISILEPAASRFSVPSKVLTYLCAGRPVLAVLDPGNAAARMLTDHGAGLVVGPDERDRIPELIRDLLDDRERRARMGSAARALAEQSFDIHKIAGEFERVLLMVELAATGDADADPVTASGSDEPAEAPGGLPR